MFQPAPDRIFVLLAAGSLATTREVVDRIRRDLDQAANPQAHPSAKGGTLWNTNYRNYSGPLQDSELYPAYANFSARLLADQGEVLRRQ